jgi:hypothetical protein
VDIENTPSLGKEGNGIFGGRIKKSVGKPTFKQEEIFELRNTVFLS